MTQQKTPSPQDTILTNEATHDVTRTRLEEHLPFDAHGYKVTNEVLQDILVHAAVTGSSIQASCQDLDLKLSPNSVREQLNRQLQPDKLSELEAGVNAALQAQLPRRVRRDAQELAVDWHDQPFYGEEDELTSRGAAKAGTTRFYRVMTAYLLRDGVRFTLAFCFVQAEEDKEAVLRRLFDYLLQAKIKLKRLWFDKGFASILVYRLLRDYKFTAVIACPARGKEDGEGTKALCRGRKGYHSTHTFEHPENGKCTVPVTVVRTWSEDKEGQRQWTYLLFVQLGKKLRPSRVRRGYRSRFGIESSYRCMRSVKGMTTTKNPLLRGLFIALSFILLNVWLYLRFLFCQVPQRGRGGRPLAKKHFQLLRFALFLRNAIEQLYGVVTAIPATAPPIGV